MLIALAAAYYREYIRPWLRKWVWSWLPLTAAFALPLLISWSAIVHSRTFDGCIDRGGQPYASSEQPNPEQPPVVLVKLHGSRLYFACTGATLSNADKAITSFTAILYLMVTCVLGLIAFRQFDTSRKELRAYLTAFPTHISSFDGMQYEAMLTITVTNVGKTPAYNVRHRSSVEVLPFPFGRTFVLTMIKNSIAPPVTIAPMSSFNAGGLAKRCFSQAELNAIVAGGLVIVVYGTVFYEDIFHRARWTRFASYVEADQAALTNLTANYTGAVNLRFQAAPAFNHST